MDAENLPLSAKIRVPQGTKTQDVKHAVEHHTYPEIAEAQGILKSLQQKRSSRPANKSQVAR